MPKLYAPGVHLAFTGPDRHPVVIKDGAELSEREWARALEIPIVKELLASFKIQPIAETIDLDSIVLNVMAGAGAPASEPVVVEINQGGEAVAQALEEEGVAVKRTRRSRKSAPAPEEDEAI